MAKAKKGKPGILLVLIIFIAVALFTYLFMTKFAGIQPIGPTPRNTPVPTPAAPALTESNQLNQATAADFKIGGMSLQSTSEEISNLYGDPLEIKKSSQVSFQNPDYQIYLQTWVYPEFEVLFINHAAKGEAAPAMPGVILTITVHSDLYPTKRGIKVGSTLEQLFAGYGRVKPEDGLYTYNNELNYLEFAVKNDKITAITVGQNPD